MQPELPLPALTLPSYCLFPAAMQKDACHILPFLSLPTVTTASIPAGSAGQTNSNLLLLCSLIGLLLVGTAAFFYLHRENRQLHGRIRKQHRIIRNHDETHAIFVKEIHHRVKNNLQIINSLIDLELNKTGVDHQAGMMEIQSKMGTIALAHHLLYEMPDMKEVDLQAYFENMVEMTLKALLPGFSNVKTSIRMNCQKLGLEKLVTLAIAVNEMIINTVKHVIPKVASGAISLECRKRGDTFCFTYRDNGIAPDLSDPALTKGTGMRLIRNLAQQMDGDIEVAVNPAHNLEYRIRFHSDTPAL